MEASVSREKGGIMIKNQTWCAIVVLLFLWSSLARAADKIKVEIVESTSVIHHLQGGGIHFSFHAKAIMPDGAHASLVCIAGDNDCAKIEPFAPEKMTPDSSNCFNSEGATTCTTKNLGFFAATRKANDLLIYGPKHKLKYHIVGSW
jgi:hypothetical protein